MGILVENHNVIPELKYNEVHIDKFEMNISKETNSIWTMKYEIIMYAVLPSGEKKFNEGSRRSVTVEDVKGRIQVGDEDALKLYQALQDFEQGMARILEVGSKDLGNTTYYEG